MSHQKRSYQVSVQNGYRTRCLTGLFGLFCILFALSFFLTCWITTEEEHSSDQCVGRWSAWGKNISYVYSLISACSLYKSQLHDLLTVYINQSICMHAATHMPSSTPSSTDLMLRVNELRAFRTMEKTVVCLYIIHDSFYDSFQYDKCNNDISSHHHQQTYYYFLSVPFPPPPQFFLSPRPCFPFSSPFVPFRTLGVSLVVCGAWSDLRTQVIFLFFLIILDHSETSDH